MQSLQNHELPLTIRFTGETYTAAETPFPFALELVNKRSGRVVARDVSVMLTACAGNKPVDKVFHLGRASEKCDTVHLTGGRAEVSKFKFVKTSKGAGKDSGGTIRLKFEAMVSGENDIQTAYSPEIVVVSRKTVKKQLANMNKTADSPLDCLNKLAAKTTAKLNEWNIYTIRDLAAWDSRTDEEISTLVNSVRKRRDALTVAQFRSYVQQAVEACNSCNDASNETNDNDNTDCNYNGNNSCIGSSASPLSSTLPSPTPTQNEGQTLCSPVVSETRAESPAPSTHPTDSDDEEDDVFATDSQLDTPSPPPPPAATTTTTTTTPPQTRDPMPSLPNSSLHLNLNFTSPKATLCVETPSPTRCMTPPSPYSPSNSGGVRCPTPSSCVAESDDLSAEGRSSSPFGPFGFDMDAAFSVLQTSLIPQAIFDPLDDNLIDAFFGRRAESPCPSSFESSDFEVDKVLQNRKSKSASVHETPQSAPCPPAHISNPTNRGMSSSWSDNLRSHVTLESLVADVVLNTPPRTEPDSPAHEPELTASDTDGKACSPPTKPRPHFAIRGAPALAELAQTRPHSASTIIGTTKKVTKRIKSASVSLTSRALSTIQKRRLSPEADSLVDEIANAHKVPLEKMGVKTVRDLAQWDFKTDEELEVLVSQMRPHKGPKFEELRALIGVAVLICTTKGSN